MGRQGKDNETQTTKQSRSKLRRGWPLIALVVVAVVVGGLIAGELAFQWAKHQGWTTYTEDDGLPDNDVNAIAVAPDGMLWVGTDRAVSRFDGQRWTTYATADSLADNEVESIAVAPDGALWVGTNGGGVSRFTPPPTGVDDGKTWTTYTQDDGLAGDVVVSVAVAPDGVVWVGAGGGVSRGSGPTTGTDTDSAVDTGDGWTWTTYTADDGLAGNYVRSIDVAPDGALWVGTSVLLLGWRGGGVTRFDGETWTVYTEDDGLAANCITSIAVGPDGTVWAGTSYMGDRSSGLSRFDGQTWTTYTEYNGLADNYVRAIAVAPNGMLWVSTGDSWSAVEVSHFDGETWNTYTSANSGLLDSPVSDLAIDDQGQVWIAADGGALFRVDGGLSVFDERVGLSAQTIQAWRQVWGILVLLGIAVLVLLPAIWAVRLVLRRPKPRPGTVSVERTTRIEAREVFQSPRALAIIVGGLLGLAASWAATQVLGGFFAEMLGFFWTGGHSLYINWRAPAEAAILWGACIGGAGVLAGGLVWVELRRRSAAEGRAMTGCLAAPGLVISCLGLVFLIDYVLASYIITQGQARSPMGFFQLASYLSSLLGGACVGVGVLVANLFARAES